MTIYQTENGSDGISGPTGAATHDWKSNTWVYCNHGRLLATGLTREEALERIGLTEADVAGLQKPYSS